MTDEEVDEKLESLDEEDIDNLEGNELLEMVERVYGEDEAHEEESERTPLQITVSEGESKEEVLARMSIKPELQAASTLLEVGVGFANDDLDINALVGVLEKQTSLVREKNLETADAMLASQAHTLDALFHKLARAASSNMGIYFDAAVGYFSLAMKAQSQCRTTWEAVAKIQNPPITNVTRQTNIAKNQQINNGGEIENPPNELSGDDLELLPDKRNTGTAIPINSQMEAVGAINRAEVTKGET
jgi:hypothetical protein